MTESWKAYCDEPERIVEGNEVILLKDGVDTFPAMLEAIDGAQTFISLETYIFQPDTIGTRFRDALTEAAARGVRVRLIYDSIGAFETDATFWKPLRDAGAQLVEFHPIAAWRHRWPVLFRLQNQYGCP